MEDAARMTHTPAIRERADSAVEKAVRYIINDTTATYAQSAQKFGCSVNGIRSRIEYRYGSLEMARDAAQEERDFLNSNHRCNVCMTPQHIDPGHHACRACRGVFDQKGDI